MKSYWIDSVEQTKKTFPKMEEDQDVEVCIIGGGLTGLSTAYYLSKTNKKIAILEKEQICMHTSGKSTAKITSQHGLFYDYLINSLGEKEAKQYLEANEQAIKNIEKIIKEEKIECEFERKDADVFTTKQEEMPKIEKEVEAVKSLGFPAELVKENLPLNALGAIKFPNQAQFNPCKYAQGLLKAMENKNITIYEKTKVVDLKSKDGRYQVITENGSKVNAKYVVIATHYPIINVPGYYFLKMYQSLSYVIAVKSKKTKLQGMYINSEKPTISLRNIKQENGEELLLIAGMDHKTGEKDDLSQKYEELIKIAKQIDSECEVKNKWCTQDCISLDKIPYIGEFSALMPNVYLGTGYKKWGMTTSNIAANIITDKILGKENEYEEVFTSTRLKPIKNYQEMGNMIKEVAKSFVIEKLKIPEANIKNIPKGDARIIEIEGKKIGVYKDEEGKLFGVKPICSHLGCELSWNNLEKTWDCPCHGSRFTFEGKTIYDPSVENLEKIEIINEI